LAVDRPDLVEEYITDESDYYGRKAEFTVNELRKGARLLDYVCDRFGSFFFLPAADNTVDEILARSVFEHMSLTESSTALRECLRVMKSGGIIRLDVPDHDATMNAFIETKDTFFIRHLLGPRKTKWGYHLASYTRQALMDHVQDNGFDYDGDEKNTCTPILQCA
jgi:predicted SAM-dependent methyltransferase